MATTKPLATTTATGITSTGLFNRDPFTFENQSSVPAPIMAVIHGILKSWDLSTTDYAYISQFHAGGKLHVAPEPTVGEEAMRKLHDDLIHPTRGPVVALQHHLDRIFLMPTPTPTPAAATPAQEPKGKTEAVFTGKLENVLKSGQTVVTEFATWIVLSESEDSKDHDQGTPTLKAELLKVYSDASALTAAIRKMERQQDGSEGR